MSKSKLIKKYAKKKGLKVKDLKMSKVKPKDFLGMPTFKKTRLQELMEREYVTTICTDCHVRIIVLKEKADNCGCCKSSNISKEVWE